MITYPQKNLLVPYFVAPMEGVTSPEVRQLIATLPGVGCVCTEFIRISNSIPGVKSLKEEIFGQPLNPLFDLSRLLPASSIKALKTEDSKSRTWLSVQVMGDNIEVMVEAARSLQQLEIDLIDLNFGCPAPLAYSKGCGSAMLKNPQKMFELVRALKLTGQKPITAKMRAGIAEGDDFVFIGRGLQEAGACHVALHARTKEQAYTGNADHNKTKLLVESLQIPVIANGDIKTATQALRVQAQTGCAGVMMGRGALANPFIFWQLAHYHLTGEKLPVAGEWLAQYLEMLGQVFLAQSKQEYRVLNRLKEIIRFSVHFLPEKNCLGILLQQQTLPDFLNLIKKYYQGREFEF